MSTRHEAVRPTVAAELRDELGKRNSIYAEAVALLAQARLRDSWRRCWARDHSEAWEHSPQRSKPPGPKSIATRRTHWDLYELAEKARRSRISFPALALRASEDRRADHRFQEAAPAGRPGVPYLAGVLEAGVLSRAAERQDGACDVAGSGTSVQMLRPGLPVWPGDTAVRPRADLGHGRTVRRSTSRRMTMSTHSGTHGDAPFHYSATTLADIASVVSRPLSRPMPGRRCERNAKGAVEDRRPTRPSMRRGSACCFALSISSRTTSGTPASRRLPPETIRWLAAQGVRLIGTDAPSVDPQDSARRMDGAFRGPRTADMRILEGLVLDDVPPGPLRVDRAAAEDRGRRRRASAARCCENWPMPDAVNLRSPQTRRRRPAGGLPRALSRSLRA